MTVGLLIPSVLTGLLALIVPLVIHIARKSEEQRVDFAALRWLRHKPKPRSRLRFDEWPLLLLRLALITLVVLALARPFLSGAPDRTPYIAIVPGASFGQSVVSKKDQAHWIAPNFPTIDQPTPSGNLPIASLIRDLDARLPAETPLTIIAPRQMIGTDAERMRLSRKVEWRIVDSKAVEQHDGPPVPTIRLSVRHDAAHRSGLRYFQGVTSVWNRATPDIATLDAPLPARDRMLVWLAGGTVPDNVLRWVEAGGTALIATDAIFPSESPQATLWRDSVGAPLVEGAAVGKGRMLRLTRRLVPSDMPELVEGDFPDHLRALLSPSAPPSRVLAADYAPTTGGQSYRQPPQDLRDWLALAIALLFAVERWVATRRTRSISP